MEPIEFELNKAKIKVFENGDIWKWVEFKHVKKWIQSKGCIQTQKKSGYCRHQTEINGKTYTTSRIIYKAFNLDWNMNDTSPDNTIDHIDRSSLNNHISNLRVANMVVQNVNRDCIINH